MSYDLSAQFYFDTNRLPAETFIQTVAFLSERTEMLDRWSSFSIHRGNFSDTVVDNPKPLLSDLIELATAHDGSDRCISVVRPMRCWRFQGRKGTLSSVPCFIDSYGSSYRSDDSRLRGQAALVPTHVGPFCALIENESDPEVREVNERVEENLETFTTTLLNLIYSIKPNSVKVYSEMGIALPFNAHLLYYADHSGPLSDLQLIREVWNEGLPAYGVPPLEKFDPRVHKSALHSWRSSEQHEELWRNLGHLIDRASHVTPQTVRQVLKSNRFSFYDVGDGFAVLNYPHFVNGFLDRFFLELLGAV